MEDSRSGGRDRRLDELPAHEDDSDVADEAGAGVIDKGLTAEVRGTGVRTGNAQRLDDEATRRDPRETARDSADEVRTSPDDATPGIDDFTETVEDAHPR